MSRQFAMECKGELDVGNGWVVRDVRDDGFLPPLEADTAHTEVRPPGPRYVPAPPLGADAAFT